MAVKEGLQEAMVKIHTFVMGLKQQNFPVVYIMQTYKAFLYCYKSVACTVYSDTTRNPLFQTSGMYLNMSCKYILLFFPNLCRCCDFKNSNSFKTGPEFIVAFSHYIFSQ